MALPDGWDVFLSFRGSDTRVNFTSHLYSALDRHGVRIFMDDPELPTGEDIGDVRIKAIRESKIYVVVFSENYASSRLCLDELAEIVECQKTMNRSIIGVYYNIDQSVVQHQTGSVGKAFKKHKARAQARFLKKKKAYTKMEKVNNWRLALTQVSEFPGETISGKRSESDAIKEVVDKVLLLIQPMNLDVAKYPVGLDSRVTHVTELMKCYTEKCYTEGVTRIGIHGMGGIGKTTLAKAVYNKNCYYFQGSCFLANVREASVSKRGLVCLQQQLIDDVLKCKNINVDNVDQGIELIRARLCSIKVLIVIDDLDDPRPLEFLEGPFALGSRIIITTRNEDLLDSIKVEIRYKVNELGDTESRQLFTQHAFGERMPERFTELSQEILEHAGGLPLALEVFGLSVFNISKEELTCVDNLKRVSIADVEKKLVLSFDALELVDPVLQDIFLDVACFFVGRNKEEVVKIMKTCYNFVNPSIDILIKRCLLTTNDRDELGMHNLIRDMGREIARNNFPGEPGKHSRLWVSKEICNVLNNHKGTEAIEGIYYQAALEGDSFTTATFKKMTKLRFLYLKKVNLIGSYEQTFEELRWFCWDCCPLKYLPSEFYSQKLVILELPRSNIRTMWEPNMVFEMLKTLDMKYSLYLTTTPNFTRLPCLETLILEHCESLEEVHISIGSLKRLVSFNLCGCVKLRSLPNSICNLRALKSLNVDGCSSLEVLPIELGNVNVDGCSSLEVLPIELGNVESLAELNVEKPTVQQKLKISFHALKFDPVLQDIFLDIACFFIGRKKEEVVKIMETCYSNVDQCIATLEKRCLLTTNNRDKLGMHDMLRDMGREIACNSSPDEPGKRSRLWVSMDIYDVLKKHKGTEAIEGIVFSNFDYQDDLEGVSFSMETFKRMSKLRFLYLRNVNLTGSFVNTLDNLRWLCWEWCPLKCLPSDFYLQKLVILELPCSKMRTIWDLNMVSQVFQKLNTLNMKYSQYLTTTPDFTKLPCLDTLNLEGCESLEEVHTSIGSLARLASLNLRGCVKLRSLPDSFCNLRALKSLNVGGCSSLLELPVELGNIESLTELNAEMLTVSKLPDSIGRLSKLVKLRLNGNKNLETLPATICNLRLLEILDISGCEKLEILPYELQELPRLRDLSSGDATLFKKTPQYKIKPDPLSL